MFLPGKQRVNDTRYRSYLRERYRCLGGYTGVLFCFIGLLITAPAGLVLFFPSEKAMTAGFLWPGLTMILLGAVLRITFGCKESDTLSIAEGAVIVLVAWIGAIIAGAVPFYWGGLTLTQAVFEATSGWTTTGLTVVNVAQASPLLLFFRSLMQLAGGAGLAIIMLSALGGSAGVGLSTAEGRADQLVPQIRQSVRLVLKLYSLYVLAGVAALKLAGMTWFEAVNHAFCAVSTGGFSTRTESIGFWNSPAIEAVLIVLMLLGSTNFLTIYTLGRGRLDAVVGNGELRVTAGIVPVAAVVLCFSLIPQAYGYCPDSLRVAVFQTVTSLTTTGFETAPLADWNGSGWLAVIMLMLVGGGTGSTAGGIKQHRMYLLIKGLKKEFTEIFFSPRVITEQKFWLGSQQRFVRERDLRKACQYMALYLLTWLAGGCALAAFGHPVADSLVEFASALGTVGLSVGVTTAAAPAGQLWIEIAGMFLGRLEFFVIFWGVVKIGKDLLRVSRP